MGIAPDVDGRRILRRHELRTGSFGRRDSIYGQMFTRSSALFEKVGAVVFWPDAVLLVKTSRFASFRFGTFRTNVCGLRHGRHPFPARSTGDPIGSLARSGLRVSQSGMAGNLWIQFCGDMPRDTSTHNSRFSPPANHAEVSRGRRSQSPG